VIRLLGILVFAGVVGLAAFWLASVEGTLTLTLPGYEIQTGAGTAAILLIFLVLALMIVLRLLVFLIRAPRYFGRRRDRALPPPGDGSEAAPQR
jgi:uncharacterized membrane-anchored protein